jgi:Mg2+ and Co2+ transporter CorA
MADPHDCLHEREFGDINSKLTTLITTVAAQTAVIANLVSNQAGEILLRNYKRNHTEMSWKKVTIISSMIIGGSGLIIAFIKLIFM